MGRKTRPVWTCDCETDPFKPGRVPRPFVWGLYEGDADLYHCFESTTVFLEFIRSRYASEKKPVIYAHNGGKFDYHYLRDHINSDQHIMVINGRLARFKIGECEFRDSLNIIPVALKAFAKDEIDYKLMEPEVRDIPHNRDLIRAYLRSDCVNLYEFVTRYQKEYGKGLTQAGAAMAYWKKLSGVQPPRQTAVQFEKYKDYYYGGRVQCFDSGYRIENFSVVDINSAYPYAMQFNHPFSVEAEYSEQLPPEKDFARCFFRVNALAKGCFPWRDSDGRYGSKGALFFPDDERQYRDYFITGWELLSALSLNACRIGKVKEVHRFTQTINFADYIEHFFQKRRAAQIAGDKAQDIFAKLLMNSLYGKFSSDPQKYKEYVIASGDSYARWLEEDFVRCDPWGERHLMARPLPVEKHRYFNIATAASITGYVRAMLFKAISSCQGVLYCDTDSLAARDVSGLPLGPNLGQWKLELAGKEWAIAGKKLYAFLGHDVKSDKEIWKVACKGVDLGPDDIIQISRQSDVEQEILYTPEVPTYSIHKPAPIFTPRTVRKTAKDIRVLQ